jgi:hypothetical protein
MTPEYWKGRAAGMTDVGTDEAILSWAERAITLKAATGEPPPAEGVSETLTHLIQLRTQKLTSVWNEILPLEVSGADWHIYGIGAMVYRLKHGPELCVKVFTQPLDSSSDGSISVDNLQVNVQYEILKALYAFKE